MSVTVTRPNGGKIDYPRATHWTQRRDGSIQIQPSMDHYLAGTWAMVSDGIFQLTPDSPPDTSTLNLLEPAVNLLERAVHLRDDCAVAHLPTAVNNLNAAIGDIERLVGQQALRDRQAHQ